jgi:hypothetical protein
LLRFQRPQWVLHELHHTPTRECLADDSAACITDVFSQALSGSSSSDSAVTTTTTVTRTTSYTTRTYPIQAALITTLPVTISAADAAPPAPTISSDVSAGVSNATASYGEKLPGQMKLNRTFELPPLPPPEPNPSDASYALPAKHAQPTALQPAAAAAAAGGSQASTVTTAAASGQDSNQQQQLKPVVAAAANSSRPATTLSVVTVTTSQPVTVKISPAKKPGMAPTTQVNVAGQPPRFINGGATQGQSELGWVRFD